jgi:hypothetical protein
MALRDTFQLELTGTPPDGWVAGHMKIHAKRPEQEDGPVITEAWTKGSFAIHFVKDGGARLSHIPTGMGIYSFETPELAAMCADEIAGFADWSKVEAQLMASDLYQKVRPVIDRIAGDQ